MKILSALVLVGFMSSGCFVQADVKSAQDALVKAQAASRRAKTPVDATKAAAAVKKAQADLEQARLDDKKDAASKAAAATKAAVTAEQAKTAAQQAEDATFLGLGSLATEEEGKEAVQDLRNVKLALKAASKVLVAADKAAAQVLYIDASEKKAPALQLALAYLPIEFFLLQIYFPTRLSFTTKFTHIALFGDDAAVCNVLYQPSWGQAKDLFKKTAITWTAKTIAQARKAADRDDRWDAIIKALAA